MIRRSSIFLALLFFLLGGTFPAYGKAGGVAALVETTPASGSSPGWSPVDKINRLQITRSGGGAWSELREFQYDASYRLTGENYLPNPGASSNDSDLLFYDSPTHNTTGGPGVLVGRKRTSDGLEWKNSTIPGSSAFARITNSTYRGKGRVVPLSGETGRGFETRGMEWARKLQKEHGLDSIVEPLRTVEGK